MTSRKLQLNRETVRILTAKEMAGLAGGAVLGTNVSCTCTNVGCPNTNNWTLAARVAK